LVNELRYADDTVLITNSDLELTELLKRVGETSEKFGLNLNIKKTNVMAISRTGLPCDVSYKGEKVEEVSSFVYLGTLITNDGRKRGDVDRRIALGKNAMASMKSIWKSSISNRIKLSLIKSLIWPVMMYGSDLWILDTRTKQRIEAFELWCYRKLLNIGWRQKRSNESVLVQLGIATPELIHIITERKLSFFGHVVRANGLTAHLITGKFNGKRPRGRPRATWISNLAEILGSSAAMCVRAARQRRISYPRDGRRSSE